MPYRNKSKRLVENGIYHAYNRSLEKRVIFISNEDYKYFISLISTYFIKLNSIEIYAFCIMSNHYHFLIKTIHKFGMSRFIQIINSEYSRYFNWKYKREGQLWQGTYKANKVDTIDEYKNVFEYIHTNPIGITEKIEKYRFSSLGHYKGIFNYKFIKKGRPQYGLP